MLCHFSLQYGYTGPIVDQQCGENAPDSGPQFAKWVIVCTQLNQNSIHLLVVMEGPMGPRATPFKRHRFPREIILMPNRWYCRFAVSCRDVRDMAAECGVTVTSTMNRLVRECGPEIRMRVYGAHRCWRGLQWQVDETYVRIEGRRCYLWQALDELFSS